MDTATEKTAKPYFAEFDAAKGILVIIFITVHTLIINENLFTRVTVPPAVPLFAFLSGMMSGRIARISGVQDYVRFMKEKFLRLMVLYLSWGLAMALPKILLNSMAAIPVNTDSFWVDFLLKGESPLTFSYFVYVLFFIFLFFSPILCWNPYAALALDVGLFALLRALTIDIAWLSFSKVLYYGLFFIVAYILRPFYPRFRKAFLSLPTAAQWVIAAFAFTAWVFAAYFHIHWDLIAVIGLGAILLLSLCTIQIPLAKFFCALGKLCLDICILHWLFYNAVRAVAEMAGFPSTLIQVRLVMFVAAWASWPVAVFCSRHIKLYRFVMGYRDPWNLPGAAIQKEKAAGSL